MAIPVLYWMLECTSCGSRRVVHDCYLVFVGSSDPDPDLDAGYAGPPLPERHTCPKGCSGSLKAVGSIFRPDADVMWLHDPHVPLEMAAAQVEEWQRLIEEPGYAGNPEISFRPPLDCS